MGLVPYYHKINISRVKISFLELVYCLLYSCTADSCQMVSANMSKKPWDRAQIKLKIVLVFIHEIVQFVTGPILLNKMDRSHKMKNRSL